MTRWYGQTELLAGRNEVRIKLSVLNPHQNLEAQEGRVVSHQVSWDADGFFDRRPVAIEARLENEG